MALKKHQIPSKMLAIKKTETPAEPETTFDFEKLTVKDMTNMLLDSNRPTSRCSILKAMIKILDSETAHDCITTGNRFLTCGEPGTGEAAAALRKAGLAILRESGRTRLPKGKTAGLHRG